MGNMVIERTVSSKHDSQRTDSQKEADITIDRATIQSSQKKRRVQSAVSRSASEKRSSQQTGYEAAPKSESSSEKTHSFHASQPDEMSAESDETLSEEDMEAPDEDHVIRVYDARFKIPAQSNLGQLMTAKGSELNQGLQNKDYRKMVRAVEMFKKITNITTLVLMSLAMVFTLGVLCWQSYNLFRQPYFLSRTRVDIVQEIDFETVTINKVQYFAYRNTTEGASDVDSSSNYYIAPNVTETCEGQGHQLIDTMHRMQQIRDNIRSPYMILSSVYVILLMMVTFAIATIWAPFKMKEHHIPAFLRKAESNVFYDFMRVRVLSFVYFMTLSGCLPHLTFYFVNDVCLHTYSQRDFGLNWTDYYQFCLTALIWVISVPITLYVAATALRDSLRYILIPLIIANITF